MADTAPVSAGMADRRIVHSLDPVASTEFVEGRRILAQAGLLTASTRFAYFGLDELPKAAVLGQPTGRRQQTIASSPACGALKRSDFPPAALTGKAVPGMSVVRRPGEALGNREDSTRRASGPPSDSPIHVVPAA